jgi:predicted dehydrogenase
LRALQTTTSRCRPRWNVSPHPLADWWDFGTWVLGDHGPHNIDVAAWALGLEFPERIEAETDPEDDPEKKTQTFPRMATVRYTFPARGKKPPVAMTWHVGNASVLPSYMKEDQLPSGGGMLVGTRGAILFGSIYMGKPGEIVPGSVKLLPEELDRSYKRPAKTLAQPQKQLAGVDRMREVRKAAERTMWRFIRNNGITEGFHNKMEEVLQR